MTPTVLRLRWAVQGRDEILPLAADELRIGRGTENEVVLVEGELTGGKEGHR